MKSDQEQNRKIEVKAGSLFEPGIGDGVELLAPFAG